MKKMQIVVGWSQTIITEFTVKAQVLTGGWLLLAMTAAASTALLHGITGYFALGSASTSAYEVRPIVCIPTSIFDNKYANSLEDD